MSAAARIEHTGVLCRDCLQVMAPAGANYCGPCRRRTPQPVGLVPLPLTVCAVTLGVTLRQLTTAIYNGSRAQVETDLERLRCLRDVIENAAEELVKVTFRAACHCGRRYTAEEYEELRREGRSRLCRCGSHV